MNFLDDKIKTESPSWPSLLLKNYFDIYTSVHVCICIYVMYTQIYTIHTQLYTSLILYVYMIYTHLYYMHALNYLRRWLGGKESACQCRRHRTHEFDLWVRKIPWRRKRQPTLVFLPGVIHGQRTLLGFSPWGCKIKLTCTHLHIQSCMHTHMYSSG